MHEFDSLSDFDMSEMTWWCYVVYLIFCVLPLVRWKTRAPTVRLHYGTFEAISPPRDRYMQKNGFVCYAVHDIRSIGKQLGRTSGRLGSTGLQPIPLEGRHSWPSGAHPQQRSSPGASLSVMGTGRAWQPENGPRRRRRGHSRDSHESVAPGPETDYLFY